MSDFTSLGPGREFDLVRAMTARWGERAFGIGDDAATLDVPVGEQLVVSTDTSVEGIHFRREWLSRGEVGWRATVGALSDLAAMAAKPLGVVVAIVLPSVDVDHLDELADGIGEAAAASAAPILGGDLTAGERLTLAITVLGSAAHPLRRSGAKPGDSLWVTGQLGGPAIALDALYGGHEVPAEARRRLARPRPRIQEAIWLAHAGATAAIDISDGLAGDAQHLAAASGVRLTIDAARLPLISSASPAVAQRSGEEYELLVTGPSSFAVGEFEQRFGLELTEIGTVDGRHTGVEFLVEGRRVAPPRGYDHFSR
jgi:thiamine-monophosphate kinase